MYQRLLDGQQETQVGGWDAARDLEHFLASFYRYFEVKGYRGILALNISHLVNLAFTIGFSFVLLFFVDWQAVLSCDSEESCRAVLLCYSKPFHHLGFRRFVVLVCFFLFSVYWFIHAHHAYQMVRDATEISNYYKDRLGIVSDEILATMTWSEVVSRLIQQQKALPFCIVQDELTALEIANIIMREDNFMTAFANHHTFTSRLPPWIPKRLVYTRSVFWNLRIAVFQHIFDERSRVRADFVERPAALAQRLRWMGVLNLILVMPVLIFVTIYFFMRHAEEFRSHRSSPFQRQWTDYARWMFREFNELPHQFKARMSRAQAMSEAYVNCTRPLSPVRDSLQRCVKYIAGSILAVLLIVALWDDTTLLFVKIQDKNLLWYLGFFGILFAIADNTEDAAPTRMAHVPNTPLHMHCALMQLVKCTHFLPPSWRSPVPLGALARGSCARSGAQRAMLCQHFAQIRAELLENFYLRRIQVLAEELLGVVFAPLLLIVYLPHTATDIVDVVQRTRHASPNLGDWCSFGCLDPAKNGSEFYGGPSLHERLHSGRENTEAREVDFAGFAPDTMISNGGKLEKSVISFILSHRLSWPVREGEEDLSMFSSQARMSGRPRSMLNPSITEDVRRRLCAGMDRAQRFSQPRSMPQQRSLRRSGATAPEVFIPLLEFTRTSPDELSESAPAAPETSACTTSAAPSSDTRPEDSHEAADGEAAMLTTEGSLSASAELDVIAPDTAATAASPQEANSASSSSDAIASGSAVDSEAAKEAQKVWGYPACALRLLFDLEEFQQREMEHVELYRFLPEELLQLERLMLTPDSAPTLPTLLGGWSEDDEADQSCGPHFFWLEVLYDYYSGRQGCADGPGNDAGATVERLEMDLSAMRGRASSPPCKVQ